MHHQSIISINNNSNNNTSSLNMKLSNRHQNHQHSHNRNISHNQSQIIPNMNSMQKVNHLFSKNHHHHHHHHHENQPQHQHKNDHNQEQIKCFTQKSKKHKSKRLRSTLKPNLSSTNTAPFNMNSQRHVGKNIFSNFLNQYNEDFSEQQKYFKLPILTSIELVNNNETKYTDVTYNKENLLFKDYVLIPSMTKYKHLLHTVFQEAQLENKSNYNIVEGKKI